MFLDMLRTPYNKTVIHLLCSEKNEKGQGEQAKIIDNSLHQESSNAGYACIIARFTD